MHTVREEHWAAN